jgi:hypothetical protein
MLSHSHGLALSHRQGVKEVMEVIVGLLKDRVEIDGTSVSSNGARTKKFKE